MGYFTYRLFQSVSLPRLRSKVKANLALYERGTIGCQSSVHLLQGNGCTALWMDNLTGQEQYLRPLGLQFGCVWMDVRYQDGDTWDLSLYEGPDHRCSHSVYPWAHEERYRPRPDHIAYRINRVCEYWPRVAARLQPYLLLWRMPIRRHGRVRWMPRPGKAHPDDRHPYGDAEQIYDVLRVFGIGEHSRRCTVQPKS